MIKIKTISLCVCLLSLSGCYSYMKKPPQQSDSLESSQKHDDALGWLFTVKYKNALYFDKSMDLATGFCKTKGKMATLYESNEGNGESDIRDVWACQTSPALNDTEVMTGVYCNFISIAPRYTVDLSNKQKERARDIYMTALIKKGIEYPVGGIAEKYRDSYVSWVLTKRDSAIKSDPVLQWFKKNCQ